MRTVLLASAAVLVLAGPGPVLAQSPAATIRPGHVPGVGVSEPASNMASNITSADASSTIAPRLPVPAVGADSGPTAYLQAARQALATGRSGEAQEAMERAESRLLDRSVDPDAVSRPDSRPVVQQLADARIALGHRDTLGAMQGVDQVLATLSAHSDTTAGAVPSAN